MTDSLELAQQVTADPTEAVETTGCLDRLGGSQRERLDRMLAAGLVERGCVFVLSLAPIRDQSIERWPSRADLVWERVERTFDTGLAVQDVCLRADDVSLLVAVASCSAYEAQARCVSLLRQIMTHFLGHAGDENIRLSRITAVVGGDLIGEPIDIQAPLLSERSLESAAGQNPRSRLWNPRLEGRSYAAPFVNIRGQLVEMCLRIVPVWCLRRGTLSSYAIRRTFPHLHRPANDFDQEAADLATAKCMIRIAEEYRRVGGAFALHMPIHFATASSHRSRIELLGLCADVRPIMRQVLIMQIEDIHDGIPQGRLREAVSMLAPFSRAVVAGVREGERLNSWIRQSGFTAVSLEAEAGGAVRPALRNLIARMRRITPNVVVHNISPTPETEIQLAALGASHFTAPLDLSDAGVQAVRAAF